MKEQARNRGRVIAVGAAALGVIGATASVIVLAGGTSAGSTSDRHAELVKQMDGNVEHLRAVLPKVMPEAHDFTVTYDKESYGDDVPFFTAVVTFTDDDGVGTFNLSIGAAPGVMTSLAKVCGSEDRSRGEHPDGTPLRCDKIRRPGGDTLVLQEEGTSENLDGVVQEVTALHATDYRGGGHTVGIFNDRLVAAVLAPDHEPTWRASLPLDEKQLTALVTDEAFALR